MTISLDWNQNNTPVKGEVCDSKHILEDNILYFSSYNHALNNT